MNVTDHKPIIFSLDQHLAMRSRRLGHYIATMATTLAINVANLLLIFNYAETASLPERLAIAVSIVSVTAFGALGGRSFLEEVKALNEDHLETGQNTRYSRYLAGLPVNLFITLTVLLIILAGLVQLWALFG